MFFRKGGEPLTRRALTAIGTSAVAAVNPDAHSYEELFRTCRELEIPKPEIDELFRRAVFNVLTNNTDDHEKNFSFLMSQNGEWHLAPAYDLTFIIATNGIEAETHHCMSIGGKFKDISIDNLLRLGRDNSVRNPEEVIDAVIKGTSNFETLAAANCVDSFHIELISRRLQELRGVSPVVSSFSFVSEDGFNVSEIRFERTAKGNNYYLFYIIQKR